MRRTASQATSQTSFVQIGVAVGLDATLIIDYSSPFTVPVVFDGGTGSQAHTLTLQNATYTTETFTHSSSSSGTIALDAENVTYSNVASIADTTLESNIAFAMLPSGLRASLRDSGANNDGISKLVTTNATFVPVSFTNPSATLKISATGGSSVRSNSTRPGRRFQCRDGNLRRPGERYIPVHQRLGRSQRDLRDPDRGHARFERPKSDHQRGSMAPASSATALPRRPS